MICVEKAANDGQRDDEGADTGKAEAGGGEAAARTGYGGISATGRNHQQNHHPDG